MESGIYKMMDVIGFYGPILLCSAHMYVLRRRFFYLFSYLFFFCVNLGFNTLLKTIIREPRPETQTNYNFVDELTTTKSAYGQQYGMPSGHTQTLFYSISFAFLATKSVPLLISSLGLAIITIIQRLKYKKHTVAQLGMGAVFGTIVGTTVFFGTRMYLRGFLD
jgi:membrane-associated phospholipid phosphatase